MSPRLLVPAALCAALTLVAVAVSMPPLVTAFFVFALILAPAVTAWVAGRGLDAMGYAAAGVLAAGAIALVGAVDNEIGNDDYPLGIVFIGTLLVGLFFTLPPVLIVALLRRE